VKDDFKRRTAFTVAITVAFWSLHFFVAQSPAQELMANSGIQTGTSKERQTVQEVRPSLEPFIDNENGLNAGDAVVYALTHNAELLAARKEIEVARSLVTQAALRPNPTVDLGGARQINGKDNMIVVEGMLPLELGGRRAARVSVAERELDIRQSAVEDLERRLAAATRKSLGEAVAAVLKLGVVEDMLTSTRGAHRLVGQRVEEGRAAPLEEKVVIVEVNRLRSMRETSKGKAEVALLELRNLMGMNPERQVRLRGDFTGMIGSPLPLAEATKRALATRPDLNAARAAERAAEGRIEQARAEGRLNANVRAGYQRTNMAFPLNGLTDTGQFRPIQDAFNFLTFGVTLNLPVKNKNQGSIEAAVATAGAEKQRREFLELTLRREVAAAYTRYEHAGRAMEIYRVGVSEQAGANLEIVRKMYELGAKTLLEYLLEQRAFIELELASIDARLETYLARVEIEAATASPALVQK